MHPARIDPSARRNGLEWLWFVIVFALLAGYFVISLLGQRQDILAWESSRLANQGRIVSDFISNDLIASNRALMHVIQENPPWSLSPANTQHVIAHMDAMVQAMPAVRTLHMTDAAGKVVVSTVPELNGRDFSQRAYFLTAQRRNDFKTLYVTPPFHSSKGTWVIILVRAIPDPSGRFGGIIWASLEFKHLALLLQSVRYADDMTTTLTHADGKEFIRHPDPEEMTGTLLPTSPDSLLGRHLASGEVATLQRGMAQRIKADVLGAFHSVQPVALQMDKPLVISLLRRMDTLMAPWRKIVLSQVSVLLAVMALSALGLFLLQRRRQVEESLHRQEEARVRESEANLRSYIEHAPDGIFIADAKGRFVEANPAACRMVGYTHAELMQLAITDIAPLGERDEHLALYEDIKLKSTSGIEFDLRRKDGGIFRAELHTALLPDARVIGFCSDITARKQTESELASYRQELETMVQQRTIELEEQSTQLAQTQFAMERVGIGVAWNDIDTGRFLYVNDETCRQLGYTRQELLQLTISDINPGFSATDIQQVAANMGASTDRLQFETVHRRKDASCYPVELTIHLHREGGRAWFITFFNDITARKVSEDLLVQAKLAAEAASRAKSTFLANMSHELRTPMNAIMGMTSLALRHAEDAKLRSQLNTIEQSSKHLLALINDILDISKIEAERFSMASQRFSLAEIIRNLQSLVYQKAMDKGLRLHVHLPPNLSTWTLLGDPMRLGQVLINLFGNAIKFTEQGSVTLRVQIIEMGADYILLRFEVQDTGMGISAEDQTRLFQRFEQLDNSSTRKYGGTGLGLAISKRLVEMMGGEIGVESAPGQGCLFWFSVRLGIEQPGVETSSEDEPQQDSAELRLQRDFAGTPILLVDDEPINLAVASEMLRLVGLQVDLAENGAQALEMAKKTRYALILMDIQMPVLNGLDATRAIHTDSLNTATPILAMTANASGQDRETCLAAGMAEHVAKPIDASHLYAVVLHWLAR
jgi:PAS domain S-box-containing protein